MMEDDRYNKLGKFYLYMIKLICFGSSKLRLCQGRNHALMAAFKKVVFANSTIIIMPENDRTKLVQN